MALVAFTISAQNITFGAKAGLNFASMAGDDADGLDGRTSFHLGVTAEIEMSDTFSIQPELLYSGQGYTADGDVTGKVDYINLPIMAKFYVADGISLEAGPQIGFLASAKSDVDGESTDIKDSLKSTDFALNLGAGYKLDSGLNFGLRYSMGLTDVYDFDTDGFKHSVLQLSVGYNF
ncbi:MAG: porin family protein [Flavobacteriaceae bacterium]